MSHDTSELGCIQEKKDESDISTSADRYATSQPPAWPNDSVAVLSKGQTSGPGAFRTLASLTADFVLREGNAQIPLKSESGAGQRWMTSNLRAARADSTKVYERARHELMISDAGAPTGLQAALEQLLNCSKGIGTADSHGGYLSYAPTAALHEGALAAFACAGLNPGLTWMPTSPMFAAMERSVLDWAGSDVLRWPSGHSGVFTSGGSVANTLGLHVARDTVAKSAGVRPSEVLFFIPDHVHYCILKGLRVLGVDASQIVPIRCDKDGRIDINSLEDAVSGNSDRLKFGAGIIVGVGGETSTGSVDPLERLAEIRDRFINLWLHVDGCFGGFFALTKRGEFLLRGLERADSVALDPHKALQAPYGVGMLMVRKENDLRNAFSMGAAYTPPTNNGLGSENIADISDLGLELTREARGAQVWLPLRAHGPLAFAKHLDWCQDAVEWIARRLEDAGDLLMVVTPPQLSTVTFRLPDQYMHVSQRELTEWLVDDVNARGHILLAPTSTSDGTSCIRVCVLSARTTPQHLTELVEDLIAAAKTIGGCATRLEHSRGNAARSLGFRVPYTVRPLPGKGLGILADEDIPQGSLVWEFEPGSCIPKTPEDILVLATSSGREVAADFLNHCFCWGEEMLYPQGDTQFFNHSHRPNIASPDGEVWLANRLILAGEEILDDYGTYQSLDFYEQLCLEFGTESSSRVAALYRSDNS
ncbi:MAG: hypothetical protein H7318_05990 [Oligoflexus sp.]|nr:hypothetical protein [Oligoflexus sp.]